MTDRARPLPRPRRAVRAGAALLGAAALALALAGCGAADPSELAGVGTATGSTSTSPSQAPSTPSTADPSPTTDRPRPTGSPRPMGHIHGLGRDPATGDVVLATHGGLFRLDPSGPAPVGPVIDLMGFAVAPDGAYLASGHPGPGTDLPQPVGLIRSTDGGVTWTSQSRGGRSDFHGLTAGAGLVAGFDGVLWVSEDGRTWTSRTIPTEPHVLAASPSGERLLATTREGLLSSTDSGRTWSPVDTPELLVAVSWADDSTVAGVGVSGRLVVSEDAGRTWSTGSRALGEVTALHAYRDGGDVVVLAVVGGSGVLSTTDLGSTTARLV